MTEMIVNMRMQPRLFKAWPAPRRIDALAFVGALVLAPFAVALFTFWVLLIPVFAIPFGAPLYLALGLPGFIWALSYRNWTPLHFAVLGLGMIIVSFWIAAALSITEYRSFIDPDFLGFYFGFGLVFGPIWSFAFAKLYNSFKRF